MLFTVQSMNLTAQEILVRIPVNLLSFVTVFQCFLNWHSVHARDS